jgi:phosphocarrier protein HPr
MSDTATSRVTVSNRLGLHARPAMEFVDCANLYACEVKVRRADADEIVDGKSIMQMMLLAATVGTELVIECDGEDAQTACDALVELVSCGFGES